MFAKGLTWSVAGFGARGMERVCKGWGALFHHIPTLDDFMPTKKSYNRGSFAAKLIFGGIVDEFKKNELGLNEGEEFIIVKKSNPIYFLRDVNPGWLRTVNIQKCNSDAAWCVKNYEYSASYADPHKNDLTEGASSLVWNTLIGKRKKLGKTKSLYYFLNGLCGRCSADYAFHLGQSDQNTRFNVHGLASAGGSRGPFVDWESVKDFELRKYNKVTKEIYAEAVDFDCHAYARNFDQMFKLSMAFGPAVADVVKQIAAVGEEARGHIVHARFDVYKYSSDPSWDFGEVPMDKDLYMVKAMKDSGLAGAPSSIGPRGFSAVWVEDMAQAQAIQASYKDQEKIIALLDVKNIFADPRFEMSMLTPARQQATARKRSAAMK